MKYQLRLLCFNLWHGLDHTKPKIMAPLENPFKRWSRRQALFRALRSLQRPSSPEVLDVYILQELNPVDRFGNWLSKKLDMSSYTAAVNVGLRAGPLSYPLFLQEGLGTFWRGLFKVSHRDSFFLSGQGSDLEGPFGLKFSLQLSERRGATVVGGQWGSKSFCFVNLHLHAGMPDKNPALRRAKEIDVLMNHISPLIDQYDAFFIGGDFNAEHGQSELSPLVAAGFEELMQSNGEPLYTWDPEINPLIRENLHLSENRSLIERDSRRQQLDHILYKVKGRSWGPKDSSRPPWTVNIRRVFDDTSYGAWLSDHCGLLCDISWTES